MIIGYFAAWIAVTSAALGALSLLAIAETTSASWMVPMRRSTEALAGTLPLCALGFLPIALSLRALYPWAAVSSRAYFTVGAFCARSALYLVSWSVIAELHRRWSLAEDATDDRAKLEALHARRRTLLALSLPWVLFTGTFAAFDWLMSLEPGWISSAYGVIFLAAGGAAGIAFTALSATRNEAARPPHLHAIGNMLLAAVMLWAYLGFGQLLIHWIGDVPHEITWYLRRTRGGYTAVAAALGLVHFGVPFLLLLVRALKRKRGPLATIAVLVMIGHLLDCALLVLPATGVSLAALLGAPIPIVAALFFARFRAAHAPLVPRHDPLLARSMRFEMPS